jgi:hypothetical protein
MAEKDQGLSDVAFAAWRSRCTSLDFLHPFRLRHARVSGLDALAQCVEAVLHTANAFKQAGINECGNRLAILVDDYAVVSVLDAVKHLPEILAKGDRTGFRDHGHPPSVHKSA